MVSAVIMSSLVSLARGVASGLMERVKTRLVDRLEESFRRKRMQNRPGRFYK